MSDPKSPIRERIARKAATALQTGDGRLSAPGALQAGDVKLLSSDPRDASLAELAKKYGLRPSAQRPAVPEYLRQLWRRVHFMIAFATARNIAMYTEAKLGQLWQVLTPLLNAAVYWLIFGEILHISRGVPNYVAFLVTGVFVFNFTQRAFISCSTVITESLPLIRALQFPRAALPLAYVIIELQQMLLSMVVLAIIVVASGEPITLYWLLAIPALLLQTIFNVGVGLFVARLGSQVNDFSQLLPFLLRTWMYMSGVLFNISTIKSIGPHFRALLELNPAAIYIWLMRNALLTTQRQSEPGFKPFNAAKCKIWNIQGHGFNLPPGQTKPTLTQLEDSAYCPRNNLVDPHHFWYYGAAWAVVALVIGFWFFWRAETRYGRG
jgi:teichoic acid transport system permease protein